MYNKIYQFFRIYISNYKILKDVQQAKDLGCWANGGIYIKMESFILK